MKIESVLSGLALACLLGCGDASKPEMETALFPPTSNSEGETFCVDTRSLDERIAAGEISVVWGTIEGVEIVRDRYERFEDGTSVVSTAPCEHKVSPAVRLMIRVQGTSWTSEEKEEIIGLGLTYQDLEFNHLIVVQNERGEDEIRDEANGMRYFPLGASIGTIVYVDASGDYRTYLHRLFGVGDDGMIYDQRPFACTPGDLNGTRIQELVEHARETSAGVPTLRDQGGLLVSHCYVVESIDE